MTASPNLLVVGAGPTGLTLALQAHAHGARVDVIDRRVEEFRPSRALLMHARTLEVLRPLGVVDAILALADTAPTVLLHGGKRPVAVPLADVAVADTAFAHVTVVRQSDVEHVLAAALAERGVPVDRGTELTELDTARQRPRVTLRTGDGTRERAYDMVAGCDGATSAVRTLAGIGWSGRAYRHDVLLADVELTESMRPDLMHVGLGRRGLCLLFPHGEAAAWRVLATRPASGAGSEPGQFGPPPSSSELVRVLADGHIPASIQDVAWSSRIRLQHRLADSFRRGTVFLAGDAAHLHSPAGGQGMNTGIQDAINLGWKLAGAAHSSRPRALLDSYEQERRPVAQAVARLTDTAFHLEAGTDRFTSWARGAVAPRLLGLLPIVLARRQLVARGFRIIGQLDVGYRSSVLSAPAASRWARGLRAGDRLPDAEVSVDGRTARVHELIASPGVHIWIGRDATAPATAGAVAVHRIDDLAGGATIAVRPDGYVGLVLPGTDDVALANWLALVGAAAGPTRA